MELMYPLQIVDVWNLGVIRYTFKKHVQEVFKFNIEICGTPFESLHVTSIIAVIISRALLLQTESRS
jgi:hypothetical protein